MPRGRFNISFVDSSFTSCSSAFSSHICSSQPSSLSFSPLSDPFASLPASPTTILAVLILTHINAHTNTQRLCTCVLYLGLRVSGVAVARAIVSVLLVIAPSFAAILATFTNTFFSLVNDNIIMVESIHTRPN